MRAIIELPQSQAAQLQAHAAKAGISRAEAVRRAIALYLAQPSAEGAEPAKLAAFGLWAKRSQPAPDGLAYQEDIRADWD